MHFYGISSKTNVKHLESLGSKLLFGLLGPKLGLMDTLVIYFVDFIGTSRAVLGFGFSFWAFLFCCVFFLVLQSYLKVQDFLGKIFLWFPFFLAGASYFGHCLFTVGLFFFGFSV